MAVRLAVLEHLARERRQARVLAVREISEEYWAPLGVWVVREVARKAMGGQPSRFDSIRSAIDEMASRIITPASQWLKRAALLDAPAQKRLTDF